MPRQAESMSRLSASVLCERDVEESNHYFALTTDWREGRVVLSLHYIAVWAEINIQQRTGSFICLWWVNLHLESTFTALLLSVLSPSYSQILVYTACKQIRICSQILQRDFRVIFVYVSSPAVFFKSLCVNVDIFYGFVSLLPCLSFLKCFFFR